MQVHFKSGNEIMFRLVGWKGKQRAGQSIREVKLTLTARLEVERGREEFGGQDYPQGGRVPGHTLSNVQRVADSPHCAAGRLHQTSAKPPKQMPFCQSTTMTSRTMFRKRKATAPDAGGQ